MPAWTTLLGDSRERLTELQTGTVDLVFTDPPYNIDRKYPGYNDNLSPSQYLGMLGSVWFQCKRLLKPTGSIAVVIGQKYQAEVLQQLKAFGFQWRNSIVWHYEFGPNQKRKFTPCWAMIHYLTVSDDFTFNDLEIRVVSRRQTVYGDRRANPIGKVPGDVWTISRVCGTFKERIDHDNQLPRALCERVIKATSNPGDVILDPFMGTGTVLEVALKLNRSAIGVELSPETYQLAVERIKNACNDDSRTG